MQLPRVSQPAAFLDSRDFARVARAIRYIDENFRAQPRLATIAAAARLSEFHFNRLFRRWAGVTPRQYLAFVTARAARATLAGPASVLDAAYALGLSGPGRLHDLLVTLDAVTPGEVKVHGHGVRMSYGFSDTPFGMALLACTSRGLSHLSFVDSGAEAAALDDLRGAWPRAKLRADDAAARTLTRRIWGDADAVTGGPSGVPLRLAVRGTNFQIRVWRALLEAPDGMSLEALTTVTGQPEHRVRAILAAYACFEPVGSTQATWRLNPSQPGLRLRPSVVNGLDNVEVVDLARSLLEETRAFAVALRQLDADLDLLEERQAVRAEGPGKGHAG